MLSGAYRGETEEYAVILSVITARRLAVLATLTKPSTIPQFPPHLWRDLSGLFLDPRFVLSELSSPRAPIKTRQGHRHAKRARRGMHALPVLPKERLRQIFVRQGTSAQQGQYPRFSFLVLPVSCESLRSLSAKRR